jgi:YD repeat-containing protein
MTFRQVCQPAAIRLVIRVYDEAGNVIETHEHAGESSTYTRFGSTLTITGERDAPRWL